MKFREQYKPNLTCNSCHLSECNQEHLLECSALIGRNELLTYIPNYIDIFDNENSTEQKYIARLMMENLKRKKITWHLTLGGWGVIYLVLLLISVQVERSNVCGIIILCPLHGI